MSGAGLLATALAALWFLPAPFLLAIAVLVSLLAFREYADLAARAGARVSRPVAGAATALVCAAVGAPGMPIEAALAGSLVAMAAIVLSGAMMDRREQGALHDMAASALAPLYLGVPLGTLAATRWVLGREATLLLIVTVATSDTLQYYAGRLFGRHPLAPLVSPKKTIEGAIGGYAGGLLAMGLLGQRWLPDLALGWRLMLGLALVTVGIVGDLFESLLKRSVGVKDAAAVIPGHGGVLDRIDALLFAAPVFYVFIRYRF